MKSESEKRLVYGLLGAAVLFCCAGQACGIVLHPDGEPNLASWMDRPDCNVVGRWSSNASFVVIAPNWIVTTRHQNTFPATVTIGDTSYICHYKAEWTGGPSSDADIQLVRLTTTSGGNPVLSYYASAYTGSDEVGQQIVVGGYGDGRGALLQTDGVTYGYDWDNSANTTQRFGTNRINDVENDSTIGSLTSDIIIADFDGLNEGESTMYECIPAAHDSGGGWFIYDSNAWKVAGLSRAVSVHYVLHQAWFRDRGEPETLCPDCLDAVRVSSYATWILETINVQADLTGDDWVDFSDFAVFARYWSRDDCNEQNNWCEGADLEPTGSVDYNDLAFLGGRWLTGWQY